MVENVRNAVVNWSMALVAAMIIASAFFAIWTYSIDRIYPPIEYGPEMGSLHPPEVERGGIVNLCRDITIKRDMVLTISRSFVATASVAGYQPRFEIGGPPILRKAGVYNQCRTIALPPEIGPGIWNVYTYVSFESFPFWHITQEAPPVQVRVLDTGTFYGSIGERM